MLIVVSAPVGRRQDDALPRDAQDRARTSPTRCPTRRAARGRARSRGRRIHFVSEPDFQQMLDRGEFAEWARVHGHLYGTPARTLEAVLDRGRGHPPRHRHAGRPAAPGPLPAGRSTSSSWRPRCGSSRRGSRSGSPTRRGEIARRLARAVDEIAAWREYDYLIVNRDVKEALQQLACIIQAERCRTSRLTLSLPIFRWAGGPGDPSRRHA